MIYWNQPNKEYPKNHKKLILKIIENRNFCLGQKQKKNNISKLMNWKYWYSDSFDISLS